MRSALILLVAASMSGAVQPAAQHGGPDHIALRGGYSVHANGTFTVKIAPLADQHLTDAKLARMSIDKVFTGGIEGSSQGQMLTTSIDAYGSGGYVAIERVTGKVNGKGGSFALQHTGTMTRKVPEMTVTVVPDSGTGELTGLRGQMTVDPARGHAYEFDYTLEP